MTIDSCSRRWMMNGITLFFSVGIIVVCAGNVSAQQLLTITTGTLPGGVVGVQYSQTLSATGGVLPYTWSIVSGSLPQGITLNPVAGTLSGTPANVGTSNFRVRVASLQQRDEKDFSIRVDSVLTITTSTLPAGTVGSTYSRGLLATGGTAPYTWSIASGSLPQGLTLSGATIGGTPSAAGTFTFTVRVTDSGQPGQTKQASMSIVINPAALGITTASLPAARVGTVYSQSLAASGGTSPYTWSIVSGNLPAGLALNGATIGGTPTAQGTSNFTVRVRDNATPSQTVQKDFTIVTNPPALSITTSSLPSGTVGTAYSQALSASGGATPYTWSIVSGSLPAGLSLNGATIGGTPSAAGTSNFTVRVADNGNPQQTAQIAFELGVTSALAITTTSLPTAAVGANYSKQLEASMQESLVWSLTSGNLPPGLNISGAGLISGRPTTAGNYTFTVRVTGGTATQTASSSFQLSVNPALSIVTTAAALPQGTTFVPYSFALTASGGVPPYAWSIISGALPSGLTLNSAGTISGTPTQGGTVVFTAQVTDSGNGVASRGFTMSVEQDVLRITTLTLPPGIQGSAYFHQLDAAGGPSPYTWAVISGTLPPGLVLTPAGALQGIPATIASASIRLRVLDSRGANDTRDFTLNVGPPIGQLTLTGVQGTVNPAEQLPFALSLPSAYPYAVQGVLNLSFRSAAVAPADDPTVQFSTGGRTVTFTFPANSTTAVFPSQLMLITGTVAGTITIAGSIQNGSSGVQLASINVQSLAPRIVSVEASRMSGGLRVLVSGYSPERRVIDIEFGFDVRMTSSTTQRVALNKVVEPEFKQWYESPASLPFGSTFVFEQIFGVEGNAASIEAVTISLRNGQGTTTSSRTPIPLN